MSIRALLLASSTAALIALPAHAQVNDEEDVVIVTGSRIPQDPNIIGAVPVQALDEEAFRLSGEINVAEIVNDIPALVSSLSGENSLTGQSTLNLRGLGGERTLTLVNGRRHVSGVRGSSSVDVGSIPRALIESVEVSTGGASAIYGADAVTGVVNFVLMDDFDGMEFDARAGISGEGDAENFTLDGIFGRNFDNDRGNVTLALSYTEDSILRAGDRDWSRNNGISSSEPPGNALLRFQPGELGADTPNFNTLFGFYGGAIPAAGDPRLAGLDLTARERALIDRAGQASRLAVTDRPTFWLTSQAGSIAPGQFGGAARAVTYVDLNNNGIADCQESFVGRNGNLAGCWVTNPDGSVRLFEDGLIVTGGQWGSGGDGGVVTRDRDTLLPETDTFSANLNGRYELSPGLTAYFESKYVQANTFVFNELDTFYDTLFIQPDNPFIPAQLQPVADATGGLLLTQDPVDFDDTGIEYERETIRLVGGLTWENESGSIFDLSVNHGRFKRTDRLNRTLLDRQFAAFDAVRGPNGEIVCRSSVDPTALYGVDFFSGRNGFAPGFYTFTPGDGQCQPLNPFGTNSVSDAARSFINVANEDEFEQTQTVLSASVVGRTGLFDFLLPDQVGFATGFEYRRETSDQTLDPIVLGILPAGSPNAGADITAVTNGVVNSVTSIDNDEQFNTSGSYNVREVYGELRIPILIDRPVFKELSLDSAIRYADYSTLGSTTTWSVGGKYSPFGGLAFRATLSEAVRAPNTSELFDPQLPIQISATQDPCDPNRVDTGTANRRANCIAALQAAGVPQSQILNGDGQYVWVNPLTGRFTGTSGGNPDLEVETADTFTMGFVLQPRFVENFALTVDFWDIDIDNAISSISSQVILEGCFDSASFPNVPFCGQFERRGDGGLADLQSGELNFARLEASGIDVSANYGFDWRDNDFGIALVGSYQDKLDRFFNPLNFSEVNPDIREIRLPQYSGNVTLSWARGPLSAQFQTSYQSKQSVDSITVISQPVIGDPVLSTTNYGDNAFFDETFIFDANASYQLNDRYRIYGGVNNIADEKPFATQTAWPVGPRGRFFFVGVNATF
ncbi:TonB-dependent receptor [uncultured Algimonas sp.]|uniref:TonB-dependent receptor domain-containing protein n=1 Tax=uncultured Algimonas sp. TaxID=1547920 RepID=UPI002603DE6D|nr:TonB-dependent receptor [uncultured Algimonas sp.]